MPAAPNEATTGANSDATAAGSAPSATQTPTLPAANDAPPRPTTPATLGEAIAAVDLRKLSPSESMTEVDLSIAEASYNIKRQTADALDDARQKLAALGFREETQPGDSYRSADYAQASFVKDGFRLALLVTQKFDDTSSSHVRMQNMGNVDTRTLPALPGAKVLYAGPASTVYVTPASVADTAAAARKILAAAGWQEYGPASAEVLDDPNQQTLTFKQNGINLTAFIVVAPAQDGQTTLQYGTTLLGHELPSHSEAVEIKYDDYRPYLTYKVAKPIEAVADFYRAALDERGWRKKTDATVDNNTRIALTFEHAEQDAVMLIEILAAEGGLAIAQVRQVSKSQLAEAQAAAERGDADTEMTVEPVTPEEGPKVTLSKSELPIPEDAKAIVENEDLGTFTYSSNLSAKEIVKLAREKLTALGWVENEVLANVTPQNASVGFDKGNASLMVVVGTAGAEGGSILNFLTSGVEWGQADEEMP